MAAKAILKDAKAPLLFFRSQFLAVAAVPKTISPNPQLIQSIQPSDQKPHRHLSGLRQYLYQQPPAVDGLRLGGALDSTVGRLLARGSDDEEKNDVCVDVSDDEDFGDFDSDDFDSEDVSDDEEENTYAQE